MIFVILAPVYAMLCCAGQYQVRSTTSMEPGFTSLIAWHYWCCQGREDIVITQNINAESCHYRNKNMGWWIWLLSRDRWNRRSGAVQALVFVGCPTAYSVGKFWMSYIQASQLPIPIPAPWVVCKPRREDLSPCRYSNPANYSIWATCEFDPEVAFVSVSTSCRSKALEARSVPTSTLGQWGSKA